jgi:spore coat polysaccharide biosynthesis predicted glycosyltransferase SpsG/RimJ/RimL family protein N-acetyltransferase
VLTLRPAREADMELLWRWVNDPLVRASAFDSAAISWDTHRRWFEGKRRDDRCVQYIVEDDGTGIGQVRFDRGDDACAEVDISVAPSARGRRYAARMLLFASAALFRDTDVDVVRARIKATNIASLTAFRAAGFQDDGRTHHAGSEIVTMTLSRLAGRGTAVFHADGGPGIGLGHAARCVGLAAAVAARGVRPLFLVDPASDIEGFIANHAFERQACVRRVEHLAEACHRVGAVALIVDSYRVSTAEMAELRSRVPVLVVFNDDDRSDVPADIVIDGSPAAAGRADASPAGTRYLRGTDFQVVRPEFVDVPSRQYAPEVRRILVTVGGGDSLGLLQALQDFFESRPGLVPGALVDIVVGPFAMTVRAQPDSRVRVVAKPADLRPLMLGADVAISGGGQTVYEMLRCATPLVAMCVGRDQERQLRAFAALDVLDYIGWAGADGWLSRLETALIRLDRDSARRERLGRAAARVIDGRGGHRIAGQLQEVLAASAMRSGRDA